eukprot:scpid6156/ scgid1424/ 
MYTQHLLNWLEDDGKSQAPVFQSDMPGVKVAAFSQLPKCGKNQTDMTGCEYTDKHKIDYMGYSIRTDLYRYTEWVSKFGLQLAGLSILNVLVLPQTQSYQENYERNGIVESRGD